jgi:hypothetical protein
VLSFLSLEAGKGIPEAKAARLAAILGMRFGLRLSEMFQVRCSDLRGIFPEADLVIRSGKSANARRILPAGLLVHQPHEIALLIQAKDNQPRDAWLLNAPGVSSRAVVKNRVDACLVRAMREVTGDPSLHTHHLRHGHVSGLYFVLLPSVRFHSSLMHSDRDAGQDEGEALAGYERSIRLGEIGYVTASRKAAHAIAIDAGHASPEVSLFSYAHVLDLALLASLHDQLDRLLPDTRLRTLLKLSEGNLRLLRHRLKPAQRLDILPLRLLSRLPKGVLDSLEPDWSRYPPQAAGPTSSWLKIIATALTCVDAGEPADKVGARHGLDAVELAAWHERALALTGNAVGPKGGRQLALKSGPRPVQPVFRRKLIRIEWSFADSVFDKVREADAGPRQAWLRDWISRAARHGISGHNEWWCKEPAEAIDFMEFAASLGVSDQRLLFIYRPRYLRDRVRQQIDLEAWSQALGVPVDRFKMHDRGDSGLASPMGLVGLQIMAAAAGDDASDEGQPDAPLKRRVGSAGFWTAIRFYEVMKDSVVQGQ